MQEVSGPAPCCSSVGPLPKEGPAFRFQAGRPTVQQSLWRLPALNGRAQLSLMQIRNRRQRGQAATVWRADYRLQAYYAVWGAPKGPLWSLLWEAALNVGGAFASIHCLPRGLTQPSRPCGSCCVHTQAWEPEHCAQKAGGGAGSLRSVSGNCAKRGRAGRRGSRAVETTRVGFSCVPWSKLLNVSELRRAEHRGGRGCPDAGQGPWQSCQQLYYRPTRMVGLRNYPR